MEMETAELTNVTWLHIRDRQDVAKSGIWLPADRSQNPVAMSSSIILQPLPMLNWPANLFDDVQAYH